MASTQVYEFFINAKAPAVWDAITRPENTEKYFFGTRVALDDEKITYRTPDGAALVEGEVIGSQEPRELTTAWRIHYDPSCAGEVSKVTWRLEPRGDVTKLTVEHDLESAPNTAKSVGTDGWSMVLSGLKTLVETGKPLALGAPG
jgi:uncharacterized protein YndB with AHSA1/START domain